ncbi:MAG: hypothetical protein RR500_03700 [Bacilli bacterium]
MKNMRKFSFNEQARRFITYIVYIIFSLYTLYKLINEPSVAGKVSYLIILFLFLGIACWAEYLHILYQNMIEALTMKGNLIEAYCYYADLKRKDFLKSYRQPLLVFETLYYQDSNQPKKSIQVIENNEKVFKSSLDYLLIKYYTYFYSNYRLGNRSQVKKYYPKVMNLKGARGKGMKVSPLYNWEFIEAIYLFSTKDYKNSLSKFKQINIKNMNPRECSQYYLEFAKIYLTLNDKENAKKMFLKTVENGKQLIYATEAKSLYDKGQG